MTCLINESPNTLISISKTEKITIVNLVAFLFLVSVIESLIFDKLKHQKKVVGSTFFLRVYSFLNINESCMNSIKAKINHQFSFHLGHEQVL